MAFPSTATDYEQLRSGIVIDNGSGYIKAGFAENESPDIRIPSIVGEVKHKQVLVRDTNDNFVGDNAFKHRGILRIRYPMRHGVIDDFQQMAQLWENVYELLKVEKSEYPVLLTEAPLNPQQNRRNMAETFFEQFGAPALFVAEQAVLSLYASGRITGTVLDSGHGVTHCVPVYEGFALPHAIKRMDLAGADVTDYLAVLLRKSGVNFHTSAEMETVGLIKQKCELSLTKTLNQMDDQVHLTQYNLPDGNRILIGKARFQAPELLFDPSLIGKEYGGVHDLVLESIHAADLDLRADLYSSIVLSGGSTLFKNFGERLFAELRQKKPHSAKLRLFAPPDRINSTWVGGSLLSSLHQFKQMWIRKDEYREAGAAILQRKSFFS